MSEVYIDSLTLENFGPFYGEHTLTFGSLEGRCGILVGGKTGAGKTHLLRALYLAVVGESGVGDLKRVETGSDATRFLFDKSLNRRAQAEGQDTVRLKVEVSLRDCAGNHDAANRITKSLRLPENVSFFSARHPETKILAEGDVAIHGQSFSNQSVFDNLAMTYPAKRAGCFNIGLLHTSISGYEGHEPYAPCTLSDLCLKEYDYWALGHVHARQELCAHPRVIFPGNTQGRNIRETGPKGCVLVSVGDGHEILECEQVRLDVIRWGRAVVNLSGAATIDELQERTSDAIRTQMGEADDRPLVLRVEFEGATLLHDWLVEETPWRDNLRALATDVGSESVWIEKIVLRTLPPAQSATLAGPLDEVHQYLQSLAGRSSAIASLEASVAPLLAKLPEDLKQEVYTWLDASGEHLPRLMTDAESLLMERLRGQGGDQ